MKDKPKTISIDGTEYVQAQQQVRESLDGYRYVIVRSKDSGCWAGWEDMEEAEEYRNFNRAKLINARRLWYWEGAATLSQLAEEGVKKPEGCKFPCEVAVVEVLGVCEVIYASPAARLSIAGVKVWEAR
jgi:serine/threonine-protein kinase RIO1